MKRDITLKDIAVALALAAAFIVDYLLDSPKMDPHVLRLIQSLE